MLLLVELVLSLFTEHLTVTNLLEDVSSDGVMLFFLEVVVRVLQVLRPMLAGICVHASLEPLFVVQDFLLIFFGVMRDISFVFELLLNSAELYSTLVSSLQEELLGIGEGVDHF